MGDYHSRLICSATVATASLILLFCTLQLNSELSFGQHYVWKRMTVKWCRATTGQRALDVCCGTGDLAGLLAKAVGPTGEVGTPVAHYV